MTNVGEDVGKLIHCWWNCEYIQLFQKAIWNYAQRVIKLCIPFDPAVLLLGLYPKEILKKGKGPVCARMFVAALFVVARNWKLNGCPSVGEWLNKLWYMNIMEYYCCVRNDQQDDFRKAWRDLHELMLSEMSRTRRSLYTSTTILYDDQF